MALITKSDLHYNDYLWTTYANDNPKITGEPDSTLLNRMEGYEILYFINKLSEIHKLKVNSSETKIEKMIGIHCSNKVINFERNFYLTLFCYPINKTNHK